MPASPASTNTPKRSSRSRIRARAQDEQEAIEDDRLRLIFTCCHPSLSDEARIALTLREVCGLATEEIARAFLTTPSTLAQRIVRAKAKIRDARIPYEVPEPDQFAPRLDSVLRVIYLVFNEGYSASSGEHALRLDLAAEAIRLGWLLVRLCPTAEVRGLLALMLLHHGRRRARTDAAGDLVPLEEQDRSLWDAGELGIGRAMALDALRTPGYGPYALQAAIVAVHSEAATAAETDWAQIAGLYDRLLQCEPSAVVALNRAVAIAMRDGPEAGLAQIEPMLNRGAARHLPPDARRARRSLPPRRPHRGGARVLRARARPRAAGTGTPLPAPASRRTRRLKKFPVACRITIRPFDQSVKGHAPRAGIFRCCSSMATRFRPTPGRR